MPAAYLALRVAAGTHVPASLADRLERTLPFVPQRRTSRQYASAHLWGFLSDEALLDTALWAESETGTAIVTGYGIADGRPLDANDILSEPDASALQQRFRGEWSACRLTDDGFDLVTSSTGTEHAYYVEGTGFTAASNRARLLWETMRAFGAPVDPDLVTLASLLTRGYVVCTDATAVRDVRLVDPRTNVSVTARSGDAVVRPCTRREPEARGAPIDWDALAAALCDNFSWLRHVRAPILAGLTGGKDSRLVLAALAHLGLTDRVDFYVSAPEAHPDAQVAASLAAKTKLTFSRKDPLERSRPLEHVTRHVVLTEGALNAWDLTGAFTYTSRVGIHGLFGEMYRGRTDRFASVGGAAQSLSRGAMGFTGILQPGVEQTHRRRVHRWIEDNRADVEPLDDELADTFYARQRVVRWAGQARLGDGLTALVTNPLHHPALLHAYESLSPADRRGERVHFELMSRLCPELVGEPLAEARWDSAMVARSTRPNVALAEPMMRTLPMLGTGWQVPALVGGWKDVRAQIEAGLPRLEPVVRPSRARAVMQVFELLFGNPDAVSSARARLQHPLLVHRAKAKKHAIVQQVLGLLTLTCFIETLRADPAPVVRVE